MEEKFIKVDLHIHTPASPCYSGNRADPQEYFGILRKAVEEGIGVIAITDHNTIAGYKTILAMTQDLRRERKYLLPIGDSIQAQSRLLEIEADLDIINSLLILPGVEFQTSNSVHVLVVFNPKIDVSEIENFLTSAGFDLESSGLHDSLSRWCVLDLLSATKQLDCFCVDAHTDSDKGFYKFLPGKTRGQAFCNDQLKAVAFKSHDTIKQIDTILNNKEFRRNTPISYVKFSDSHSTDTIGKNYTWMKLESKDYQSLVVALGNPIECISIEKPETASIIANLIKEPQSIYVEACDDYPSIAKSIIALANSGGGYCLIGVSQNGTCKGVGYHPQDGNYDDLYKNVSKLWISSGEFRLFITDYELQGKKYLISIYVKSLTGLTYFKDDESVYRHDKKTYKKASPEYIESIVESELLKKIEKMIQPKIEDIEFNLTFVKGSFATLRLVSKLRDTLKSVNEYASVRVVHSKIVSDNECFDSALSLKNDNPNGISTGNVIIIDSEISPRYPYAYLRLSPPVFAYVHDLEPNVPKNSILINNNGCVFWVDSDSVVVSEKPEKNLVLSLKCPLEMHEKLCSFVALYLKSTFLFWYILSFTDNINLFVPDVFRRLKIPRLIFKNEKTKELLDSIHQNAFEIMIQEREFLDNLLELKNQGCEDEESDELVMEFNRVISGQFGAIDQKIYDFMHLKEDEITTIRQRVKYAGYYLDESSSYVSEENQSDTLNESIKENL